MRALLAASALALLAGCANRRRAGDPLPLPPSSESALPALVDQSTVAVSAAAPVVVAAPAPEPAAAPAPAPKPGRRAPRRKEKPVPPAPPAKVRVWGRVAISTAILSPSQLLGPEVPYNASFRPLPAFPEKLVMDVSWGLLAVGQATLGVDKIVMFNGRPAYHLVSEARSNSFCDTFYPVRDLNEAWLDAATLTSLGYSKKLREGRFFRDEWVLYDRDEGTFVARRVDKLGHFAVRVGTIPARVQDVLSSVYYVRAQPLPDGAQIVVDVNTPDNWPLVIQVKGRETVSVPAGRTPSVQIEPAMRREGLFVQKGKRLQLWLSDDEKRRPVLMKVEVFFGHVTAALRQML